jgi:hypothetical protein
VKRDYSPAYWRAQLVQLVADGDRRPPTLLLDK